MNKNIYWSVYKNLEREIIELSNHIHFDDNQVTIYSVKISELIIRCVVEIESIVKELYFDNDGTNPTDRDLYFDTDCIELLERKWQLSKKQVIVSASNFYFQKDENIILTPLKKANKRGTSSSDWQKAYQAVKHNRMANLAKGNIKHLIRSMAALYILNLYYKDNLYNLGNDSNGTDFNNNLNSSIFSIKLHIDREISLDGKYSKNADYDECIYILKPTDETKTIVQNAIKVLNDKTIKKMQEDISLNKVGNDIWIQTAKENSSLLKNAFDRLRYEAVLNKQQY